MKVVGRSTTESYDFRLKPEVSVNVASCYFCPNDIIQSVSAHQKYLSIIWYNIRHHGLEWTDIDTLLSKSLLFNIFSRISRRMASVHWNDNATPTDLESSSSESSAKPRTELEKTGWNDPPNKLESEADPPPNKMARFELNIN